MRNVDGECLVADCLNRHYDISITTEQIDIPNYIDIRISQNMRKLWPQKMELRRREYLICSQPEHNL